MTRAEVIATAKRIHAIATHSHPDHQNIAWEDLNPVNVAACMAVAKWHLRRVKAAPLRGLCEPVKVTT